jgi:hypothetical protein
MTIISIPMKRSRTRHRLRTMPKRMAVQEHWWTQRTNTVHQPRLGVQRITWSYTNKHGGMSDVAHLSIQHCTHSRQVYGRTSNYNDNQPCSHFCRVIDSLSLNLHWRDKTSQLQQKIWPKTFERRWQCTKGLLSVDRGGFIVKKCWLWVAMTCSMIVCWSGAHIVPWIRTHCDGKMFDLDGTHGHSLHTNHKQHTPIQLTQFKATTLHRLAVSSLLTCRTFPAITMDV